MHHNQRIIMWLEQTYGEGNENVKITIEALEKQIPKKPIVDINFPDGFKLGYCPVCEYNCIGTNDKFCCKCGQALDWSDME